MSGFNQWRGHSVIVLDLGLRFNDLSVQVRLACSLLLDLLCESLNFTGINTNLVLKFGLFLDHDLNRVLDFCQQVAIVLSVL